MIQFFFLLVTGLVLLAGCESEAGVPPTSSTPSTAPTASTGTAVLPTPTEQALPAEPVTSTYFLATEDLPVVRFEPSGVGLPVEVPPRSEYSIGLSGRYELEGRGMVFVFTGDVIRPGFWMRNTHIDLDIAFVDAEGRIIHITTMLADTADVHHPGQDYDVAIEAVAGWFAGHGVEVGHTVALPFDLEALLGR